MNKKGKTEKVWDKISSTLKEIEVGLDESDLTLEELNALEKEFSSVELHAYKVKLNFEMRVLEKETPTLSSKDVLVKMLSLLPSDIPKSFLPELTNFVLDEWDNFSKKMAA